MNQQITRPEMKALGEQMRERLLERTTTQFDALVVVVRQKLSDLLDEAVPNKVSQIRQDAWFHFKKAQPQWREHTLRFWQEALAPVDLAAQASQRGKLELIETGKIENKIVASRLALALMDEAAPHINELRKRFRAMNQGEALPEADIVNPDVLILAIVEGWSASGMSDEAWQLVAETVRHFLILKMPAVYDQCNEDLEALGILPVADKAFKVRASTQKVSPSAGFVQPASQAMQAQHGAAATSAGSGTGAPLQAGAKGFPGRAHRAQNLLQQVGRLVFGTPDAAALHAQVTQVANPWQNTFNVPAGADGAYLDAAGSKGEGDQSSTAFYNPPSATLMAASYQSPVLADAYYEQVPGLALVSATPQLVQRVAAGLVEQSASIKRQAGTDNEKALIELVSLMFQAILQEARIPAGIRVWFARLQMPVLRLALEDPGFFNNAAHPARKLIDHMGSCVLGFDASDVSSAALESEISRIVQVVEQYPETGPRVYIKVYEELQAFLKQHLKGKPETEHVLSMVESLELKETMTIQYTIELRNQLKDMPVGEDIRNFLFKTWSEVMAVGTVRSGPQHEKTLTLKRTASELIWAASSKSTRAERARVISTLPGLLKNLRTGMALLGSDEASTEEQFQVISNALADAFMSKAQGIDDAHIQALAKRLANLEDYVSEDGLDEMQIDAQAIEDLLGVDVSGLKVITSGGQAASADMLKWVSQVTLGSWFNLEHAGQNLLVQHAWRSPLGHLHLFATALGDSYLMQTQRMAAYLEADLMKPQEIDSLTTRATRDAMAKLQAQPDLLLD